MVSEALANGTCGFPCPVSSIGTLAAPEFLRLDFPRREQMASGNNEGSSNSPQSGLNSAEYRAKRLTKLSCLIAVLQVAIAKISRSMDLPGPDEERLLRIRRNLENTLSICKRAKLTLETGSPSGGTGKASTEAEKMSYRDYVEFSSIDEYRKFKVLPPIDKKDVSITDLDELVRKLSAGE